MTGTSKSGTSRKRTTLPRAARPGWLARMDQRSQIARALNERIAVIGEDLGGIESLSGLSRSMVERFVHVEALVQQYEGRARDGKPVDVTEYLAVVDRVVRVASTLGFARKARTVYGVQEYAANKAQDKGGAGGR